MVDIARRLLIIFLSSGFIFLLFQMGSSIADEFEDRGVISPNLAIARFFSSLRDNEVGSISRLFMRGDKVILSGLDGNRYKGDIRAMDYLRSWLDVERIDLGAMVSNLEVRHETAEAEGFADGEVLDLHSGLSSRLRVHFRAIFLRCEGGGRWCINTLVLEKTENDDKV